MKCFKVVLLVLAFLLSSPLFAEVVAIAGVKHSVTDFFHSSDTRRIANIEIFGDSGQEITFDITAIVSGLGEIKPDVICRSSYARENCYTMDRPKIYDFVYDIRMTASCIAEDGSKIAIGADRDNKNIYTNVPISELRKEVILTIDNTLITEGKCDNLTVDIQGDMDVIQDVDLEVYIYEVF
ncbi:hypothetical protein [Microbulbifer variabilis]|uniref:hypothetical protein n=1 Tax=Microbulbifer variabilis TaxID=266805 RepID=UPI000369EC8A|nr:hypothetical protein [Microbulbifer variabilis]